MLKARRQHQKTRKLIEKAAKEAKRALTLSLKGPVPKKEKVKKVRVKKEKVQSETKVVKKPKLTKEELSRQESSTKKAGGAAGKKGA